MKRKRKIKNSFLILISIIFLTAGINFKVFAANENGKNISTSNNDLLEISKTAKAIHNERSDQLKDRSYKIDLNVKAKEEALKNQKPKDVILVLDQSGSMYFPAYGRNKPIDCLKKSVSKFSKDLLSASPNSKISLIAFSSGGKDRDSKEKEYREIIPFDGGDLYKGWVIYDGEYEKVKVGQESDGSYWGKMYDLKDNSEKSFPAKYFNGRWHIIVDVGDPEDAQLKTDFTNNLSEIEKQINSISAGGGTNTESALFKVDSQLKKVKNNSNEKYVIFFTDGMPNMLVGDFSSSDNVMERTIDTYKSIESKNRNVHFISLGFKSQDSEDSNRSRYFLRSIENYNTQIDPYCKGLIYIKDPNDIQAIYDKISNKITSVTDDATITDTVPDGFEIVKGSEEPKGAIIENNKIMWTKQSIGKDNMTYTFNIKAKDTNFGTENLISDKNTVENPKVNISKDKDMMTNTEATVNYTYNLDNSKHTQTFNVPHVQVPNTGELNLIDNPRTYYYGEKIKLKDLIKTLNVKYGPEDGYTYIWSDNHGHSITLNNEKKNAKAGNSFDKNSTDNDSITLTDDTTFTLEIKGESKYDNDGKATLDLKDSVNIKVINPKVTIVKKVDGENNSDNVFSFKVTGNNNTWNLDIKQNSTFTLNNLKKGTYTLSEIDSQGYKLESIKINGKEVNLDNPSFSIDDENANIQIEIVNKKLPKSNYYNNTEIMENEF